MEDTIIIDEEELKKISGGKSIEELPGIKRGSWYKSNENENSIASVESIMEYQGLCFVFVNTFTVSSYSRHEYNYVRMITMKPDYFRTIYTTEIEWY